MWFDIIFSFCCGSILGTYYEQIINFIKFYLMNETIFWEPRRGVLYGSFSPLYGGVLMVVLFSNRNLKWGKLLYM